MEELVYVMHRGGITLMAREMQGEYCLGTGAATFHDLLEAITFHRDREERLFHLVEEHYLAETVQGGES